MKNFKIEIILLLPAAFLFLMFTNNTRNNQRDFIWQQVPLGGNNININPISEAY